MRILLTAMLAGLAITVQAATFEPEWGRDGMVVTSVAPAAQAGHDMLARGGNAVDAAIAVSFAASVAHPFSSGLGGGVFAVSYWAETGEVRTLDGREAAPASASPEFYEQNPEAIRSGKYSVGVPGLVQSLWALHHEYGSLPWADLVEPAIDLAENGVVVGDWHRWALERVVDALAEYPETRRVQTLDGKVFPLGWQFKQPDLANTLRHIQEHGGSALALGRYAEKIEAATDGVVTQLDLARYRPIWREPIRGSYRGYEVVSMPPPSSGGILLVQMLNMLEGQDLTAFGHGSGDYVHLVASVMKLAFEDRAELLGDSDFFDVPVERLVSKAYAAQQFARYRPNGQPVPRSDVVPVDEDEGTTQISVMDRFGNAISLTQTINTILGSKITVPGTGIVLNNELDDFSVGPELPNAWEAVGSAANSIAPFKRPLSSMTPTLVLRDGRPVMVAGSPMGTTIISSVLQAMVNVIDFGFDVQRAVQSPRFHHQWSPDRLRIEPEFPTEVRAVLQSRGHELQETAFFGAVQLIHYDPETCLFRGGADGRRDSAAMGVNVRPVPLPSEEVACTLPAPEAVQAAAN
ncbi:MAG: gamma-glutamyltransferase [Xanthomonadales bacterium]|nr:gamma-glutamyltransferase [Xanthomonadales bacterium]